MTEVTTFTVCIWDDPWQPWSDDLIQLLVGKRLGPDGPLAGAVIVRAWADGTKVMVELDHAGGPQIE